MNRHERKKASRLARRAADKVQSAEADQVPPPRGYRAKKTLRLEMRPREGSLMLAFPGEVRDWRRSWKSYATERDRDEALAKMNRSDRLYEYRIPPA